MTVELRGRGHIPVRCAACGWDNDKRLTLIDRWQTDYPPVPYRGPMLEVYADGDDPESHTIECEGCDGYLDGDTVLERECLCGGSGLIRWLRRPPDPQTADDRPCPYCDEGRSQRSVRPSLSNDPAAVNPEP